MQISRILLIGNGEAVSARLLKQLARQADYVLAVDGGANNALASGVMPDGVIGDLDSVSACAKKQLADRILHVPTQENTDLEKALLWLKKHHFTHATLAGFVGDRWDFCVGNVLFLTSYARKLNLTLAGDGWRMDLLTHGAAFPTKLKKRVSLIPLTRCTGVTLTGLKYLLAGETLKVGTTRSLSNQTAALEFSVQLSRGILLVYREV